jgi:hypothetical protein
MFLIHFFLFPISFFQVVLFNIQNVQNRNITPLLGSCRAREGDYRFGLPVALLSLRTETSSQSKFAHSATLGYVLKLKSPLKPF